MQTLQYCITGRFGELCSASVDSKFPQSGIRGGNPIGYYTLFPAELNNPKVK